MRSLKILVAEDDDQNQAIMSLILNRQGHIVKCVWNGIEALEAVKAEVFDLIFMDVQMPEMDGIEATKKIRQWENNLTHTPIVILTGSVPLEVTDEYKKAGADTYVFKPFDIKRITKLIDIFQEGLESKYTAGTDKSSTKTAAESPVLDTDEALPRFDNNKEYYFNNLDEFLRSLSDRLSKVDSAVSAKNWQAVSIEAHNLKGVAANYGAMQLAAMASQLESLIQKGSKNLLAPVSELHQGASVLSELANAAIAQFRSVNSNPSGGN